MAANQQIFNQNATLVYGVNQPTVFVPTVKSVNRAPTTGDFGFTGCFWIDSSTTNGTPYMWCKNVGGANQWVPSPTTGIIVATSVTTGTLTVVGTALINATGTAATTIGNATGALSFIGSAVGVTGPLTVVGTTLINTTGTAATTIGNATGALGLIGTTVGVTGTANFNTTGTAATNIGNATGKTAVTGDETITSGNLILATAGKGIQIKQDAGATAGQSAITGVTPLDITVTGATSSSVVLVSILAPTNAGNWTVTPGAGKFTIVSDGATDTSTFAYLVINAA